VSSPLAVHFRLSLGLSPEIEDKKKHMSSVLYASIIGSILYAMTCTHPDISHVVSVVNIFMVNPSKVH
jgi:ATP-binding cassette subfamily B (MDR/TAP) protein 1